MTVPSESRIVTDSGGLVVTDDGRRVNVIDRGTGTLAIACFVLGILALVVGGFGAVAWFTLSAGVGAVFLAAGVLVAIGALVALRALRRRRTRPLHACRSVAVLDRKLGLFSVAGGGLLPLDQIRFQREMRLGSSSRSLVASWPGGARILKRGNLFDGNIGDVDQVLTALVSAPR